MNFMDLGCDLSLSYTDKNNVELTENALKEPLDNDYKKSYIRQKDANLVSNNDLQKASMQKADEITNGVKPKINGPVV